MVCEDACGAKHAIDKSRLAVVYVRDERDVTNRLVRHECEGTAHLIGLTLIAQVCFGIGRFNACAIHTRA